VGGPEGEGVLSYVLLRLAHLGARRCFGLLGTANLSFFQLSSR